MAKKRYKAEEIINILRQVEVLVSQGQVSTLINKLQLRGGYPEASLW